MPTLSNTIQSITRKHLEEKRGRLYAQCVRAVGWIGGSVPEMTEEDGIVEIPTSDVSNGGVVVGAALAGERPIYVVRYQGFLTYNMSSILNYAAKSLEMWGQPCPVLVRALGMEGSMGPVASNMHHSSVMRMPGIKVAAPVTPNEWKACYEMFMAHDNPFFISESRLAFKNEREFPNVLRNGTIGTIFLVGPARLNHDEIVEAFPYCNVIHIVELSPFFEGIGGIRAMQHSKFGVVVDGDYTSCGASESIAYQLMHKHGKPVYALGLEGRTAGFSRERDNVTPTIEQIKAAIDKI